MKSYRWSGINLQGKKIQGVCEALNENSARNNLRLQGIAYIKLTVKIPFLRRRKQKIAFQDRIIFYRQLATLIAAGVPLTRGLDILSQNHHSFLLGKLIQNLKTDIESGRNLFFAMSKHPRHFDTLTCHLIQVGEHSGTLENMLLRIANYKEKSLLLKNKIKQALFYPAIILVTAVIVTFTLLTFVVPQFAELFQNFQGSLPYFTRAVIGISHFFCHEYGLLVIPILLSALFSYRYKKFPASKLTADNFILNVPSIGNLVKKFILARFTRTLAITVAAGTPINDALKMLIEINANAIFKNATQQLYADVTAGQQLHKSMRSAGIFPTLAVQMIQVGEESGSLEQMLEKIATFYESEIDYTITCFSLLLEPLIIIILGVLIGGLVIAMYLPIFKLGTVL